jgi:uncharacterized repeat protein (TIGR01451 family)
MTQTLKSTLVGLSRVRMSFQKKAARLFLAGALASSFFSTPVDADPAANMASFSQTTAGAFSTPVPDGTCSGNISVRGGAGASSAAAGVTGAQGGGGATINATFKVLPLQTVSGTVGAGGIVVAPGVAGGGGAGAAAGGNAGQVPPGQAHRGGGGGGSTELRVAGQVLMIAGGGGGSGAAHGSSGSGGSGGYTGIGPGTAAPGVDGIAGVQTGSTVGGGKGGQAAAGGAGGLMAPDGVPSYSGFAGGGIGVGTGGNGGNDTNPDTGGGGGGGYTGGGGGSSTVLAAGTGNLSGAGAGGGGGSSFVTAASPTFAAPAPTSVSGTIGVPTAAGSVAGAAGTATIDWVPCKYQLNVTKSASPTPVKAGAKTTWTVTVTNAGPDPMTRGDTITLDDTLPAGPNGVPAPAYKVTSINSAGGANPDMASSAMSCTGVTFGAAMPTRTVCSRPYDAPAAPGAPTGSTRGLDVGESLTITYEQVISSKASCASITNTASTLDRSTLSGTADIIGVNVARTAATPLAVQCYDLAVTKTVSTPALALGQSMTWTVTVKNNGVADMTGPDDTLANPLVVTDAAPTTNLSAPTSFTSTGPAGACTYAAGTITCPSGLAALQSQVFTFSQTVGAGAANGNTFTNSASVTDFNPGDTNDSASAVTTVAAKPTLQITKISNGGVDAFTFTGDNGWTSQSITTATAGTGVTGALQTLASAGVATTITETMPAGYGMASATCTGLGAGGTATPNLATGTLVLDAPATAAGSNIACTITNNKLPTIQITKISQADIGTFNFSGNNGFANQSVTTTVSGTAITSTVQTLAAANTVTTITEAATPGFTLTNISCAGVGVGNTTNNLAAGSVQIATAGTAPGRVVNCTFTNAAPPKLTLTKSIVNTGGGTATVTTFPLTATGPTTITGASGTATVTNAKVPAGTYALSETTSADYTAGAWSCTAGTLTGSSLVLALGQVANCSITNTFVPAPALTMTKSSTAATTALGTLSTLVDGGDTISYTFSVKNIGNVTLTGVKPVDNGPKFNGLSGSNTLSAFSPLSVTLAPGASQDFTATYTLSQADVNNAAGVTNGVSNTATATGTTPAGGTTTSAGSTATQTIAKTSALATSKSASTPTANLGAVVTTTDGGDTITYTYTVKNTGNVTLTNVVPTDAGPKFNGTIGTGSLGAYSPTSATILPGATQSFTATYTLTQVDVNNAAGITNGVTNTATAAGTQPGGATTTSPTGTAATTIVKTSTLTFSKSAAAPTVNLGAVSTTTDGGDTITYTYLVTNTGNVTLTGVKPVDVGPAFNGQTRTGTLSAFSPATADLAPGASQSFAATYTLSQGDVNNAAGITTAVNNTATATGTQPGGATTTSPTSTATQTIVESSSLTVAKSASAPTTSAGANTTATDAGDTIVYTYTVKNTGNVSLFIVQPQDSGPTFNGNLGTGVLSAFAPASVTILPGATQVFSATYTLSQLDVNAAAGMTGGVSNTATASGKTPTGGTTTAPGSTATTTISEVSTLTAAKSASAPGVALGTSATLTDVGDRITYTYTIKNTGNVTLTGVVPTDAGPKFNNTAGTAALSPFSPASATLAPNATQDFTATYTLSQTDINNGAGITNGVTNTAAATGTQPDGGTTTAASTTATSTIAETSTLAVTKTAAAPTTNLGSVSTTTDGGDKITYTYVVKNTGNVTLTGVVPTDSGPTFNGTAGSGTLGAFAPASTTLAPNATATFTATYTLSQSDVNNAAGITNAVSNTASATGSKPSGGAVTSPGSTATATIAKTSGLTTTKTAAAPTKTAGASISLTDAGDTIAYTYDVRNTGNVSLTGVKPTDAGPTFNGTAGTGTLSALTPTTATILPGATQTFTAIYTLSQADVNNAAGISSGVANTATASGTQPGGATTTSPSSTANTTIGGGPSLTIAKVANATTVTALPATITYTITVVNTGNVTLDGVALTDQAMQGAALTLTSGPTLSSGDANTNSKIDIGETWVYTATYDVNQANFNAGTNIVNTATIDTNQTTPQNATASTIVGQSAALTTDKTVTSISVDKGASASATDALDVITYNYLVTNTGNVTLTNVHPNDTGPTFAGSAGTNALSAFAPATAILAPGDTQNFAATYVLSQSDVDRAAGTSNAAVNAATATGTKPGGGTTTSPSDTVQTTIPNASSMTLVKTGTLNAGANGRADAGDTISYAFSIKNTGNTTISVISVSDLIPGVNVSGGPVTLAPGATNSTAITATYTLTQADVDAGTVVNTATASGKDPRNTTVSGTDGETVSLANVPSLAISKATTTASFDAVGNILSYQYTVTNTGNRTLTTAIDVTDNKIGTFSCALAGNIAPGGTVTCSANYTIAQADIDAGGVTNTATAASGGTTSAADSVTVPSVKKPAMTMVKNATSVAFTIPGDVSNYEYIITNTGNTTITDHITVSDNRIASVNCPVWPGTGLAPGDTYTCTASYAATQDDLDLGSVTNLATATDGTTTTPPASRTIPANAQPALTLTKVALTPAFAAVGDVISYQYDVKNTGNVTLTQPVTITDDKFSPSTFSCFSGFNLTPLPPDNIKSCTANYTVTQADLDRGFVTNNAFASTTFGTTPINVTSPPDSETVNAGTAPALQVIKSVLPATAPAAGDVLTYTLAVKNTGNQTLSSINVTDPLIPSLACTIATLNVNTTDNSCTGTYTVTQADVDAGTIHNVASASGVNPQGNPVSDTGTLDKATSVASPAMTLVKTPSLASYNAPGQPIGYTFTVANTGNVTLTNIKITDPKVPSLATNPSCTIASLAPGASNNSCSGTYTTTQADVDANQVDNTATVSATPARGTLANVTAAATVTSDRAPSLSIVKTGTLVQTVMSPPARADVGDQINYTFIVKNTGNVTLTNVVVTDPLLTVSGAAITLAPGAQDTATFTGTYALTQADINAGDRPNTATVTGTAAGVGNVSATGSENIALPNNPSLSLVKAGTLNNSVLIPNNRSDVGDKIAYAFTVENTGNVTLTNVKVTDPLVPAFSCTIASLLPGDVNTTCATSYTLEQPDINAGTRNNTAKVEGTPPTGPPVNTTASESTPLASAPAMTLAKTGTLNDGSDGRADVGDTITYAFTVTNTGNVTLTNVKVTDPLVTILGGPLPSLAPGAANSTTFTATYTLTQADVDAGTRANTATTAGTPPTGTDITADGSETTALGASPSLAILKAGTLDDSVVVPAGRADLGDKIDYTFTVTNTGNVTLTNVVVTDPLVPTFTCTIATLAPGANDNTCATSYTLINQTDLNAGSLTNTASVTGKPPTGANVNATDSETTPLTGAPALTLAKAGSLDDAVMAPTGRADVGDTINYTFAVTNSGNVTLTNVKITDPLIPALAANTACTIASLAPGATDNGCTGTYTLTQSDVNAGARANTASVTGKPPTGANVGTTDSTTVPLTAAPAITFTKAGTLDMTVVPLATRSDVGDKIAYVFKVTNTGNVTLTNVRITDPLMPAVAAAPACTIATLAPGAANSACTGSYTLTQADVDAGTRANTASVAATPPTGADLTTTDTKTITLPSDSTITLAKTGTLDLGANGVANVGDAVSYTFTVTNTGNVTLTNVSLTDPVAAVTGGPIASLAPGAVDTTTFTATYALTQADVDAGTRPNTATVSATPPTGAPVTAIGSKTITITATPSVALVKTATLSDGGDGRADVGDKVTYGFAVSNTGNVTLTNVTVTDPLAIMAGGPIASLLPGATDTITFAATHTLTQADIDAGQVQNQATAAGKSPTGVDITDLSDESTPGTGIGKDDPTILPLGATPSITVVKTAATPTVNLGADASVTDKDDTIDYSFLVTNTGNVTLTAIAVTDTKVTGVTCPTSTLAPAASTTCSATYVIKQADLDLGSITNQATATGKPPTGAAVTDLSDESTPGAGAGNDDPTVTPLGQTTGITFAKAGTLDMAVVALATQSDVGDKINYVFTVKNTGNVTLSNVRITDPLIPAVAAAPACTIATLAPGAASNACTGTYTLAQADIDAGTRLNTANVAATPPTGADLTATDTKTIALPTSSTIALAKNGTLDLGTNGVADVGDVVSYTFTVTNTGNVTLTNVTLTDPVATVTGGPIASLAPGAADTTTFTATYALTQVDIDAGTRANTATVEGTSPLGAPVTSTGSKTITITTTPSIALVKTATLNDGGDGRADVGDTVSYVLTASNTGNVTLTNVVVTDPLVTVVGAPVTLLPAGSANFTATHTLTQIDIDAGKVQNQATATGTPPTGADVSDLSDEATPGSGAGKDDPTVLTLGASPSITVVKTAAAPTVALGADTVITDYDDTIAYNFDVTNTGNVTLTAVAVTDTKVAGLTCPVAVLLPAARTTCMATYVINQADLDLGSITNQATAKGKPPTGADVTDLSDEATPGTGTGNDDPTVTPLGQTAAITIVKTAATPTTSFGPSATTTDVGDKIAYSFNVTNTGNVTLDPMAVTDTKVGTVSCPVTSILPAQTALCLATYVITQADVDAGKVTNQATAAGTPPSGVDVSDLSDESSKGSGAGNDDPTVTLIPQTSTIGIVKAATNNDENGDGAAQLGETISYAFSVRNTGNVTLTNVIITDPVVAVTGGPILTLAPGATDTLTFTANYTLLAADLTSGIVTNTAIVSASTQSGTPVTDASDSANPSDGFPAGNFGSGSGNDDPTVVLLNPLPIVATNDSATGSFGLNGNPNVLNVLGNDTLGTSPATPTTVTIKVDPSTPVPPQLTFDVATGQVGVVAGTPAGTYTFDYQICEIASPTNCRIATATVVVTFATIAATDNILTKTFDTKDALSNVVNVLNNDTLDGAAIDPSKVTVTPVGTLPAGIALNPDGSIDLAQYLASGTYTFSYQICEKANPANCATATVRIPVKKSVPALSGTVFFDANGNGVMDGGEQPQKGYIVKLLHNGVLVDQTTSASDGTYKMAGFEPGSGFQVVFIDPANGVAVGSIDNLTFANDTILTKQNQPIDPSGVMYNSVTGKPVAGVRVTMTTKNGTPLPAVCLLQGQQNQVTGANGRYRFDIVGGADPACPAGKTEYRLKIVTPATYHPAPSTKYKPQVGAIDADNCPVDAVPGGVCQLSADINQPSPTAPTPYFLAFVLGSGSPDIVNNHIPLDPILVLAPDTFTKTANVGTVLRGQTVTYTIAATKVETSPNTIVDIIPPGFTFVDGTATNNGKVVTPAITGRNLTFSNLVADSAKAISLKLKLVANAAVTTGTHTNIAQFIDPASGNVLAAAKANVEVLPEHVFDCGEIIGKVFDDKNRNGYQDEGEPGLPGVRLATVKGVLITTDDSGRYHVACADVPDADIGSNFILKLDTRTLPTGYRLTTENPGAVRLTRGKVTKLNFGASITRVVSLDLTDKVFATGSANIGPRVNAIVTQVIATLDHDPSTLRLTYHVGHEGQDLARKRMTAVVKAIEDKWQTRDGRYKLPIETRIVGAQ